MSSSSSSYLVVPWYDSDEWHDVYANIFSDNLARKEEALKTLYLWKARCPALPSGIESTLGILRMHVEYLKNDSSREEEEGIDLEVLRFACPTAIVRFINHMLDSETEKGTSLYKAANKLGVPDWIVELRHNIAHNSTLPHTLLLKKACTTVLTWLQNNYWDKQKPYIKDYVSGQKDYVYGHGTLTNLINSCISLGICSLPKIKITMLSDIPDDKMKESLMRDLTELFGGIIDMPDWNDVSIAKIIALLNTHSRKLLKIENVSTAIYEALIGDDTLFLSRELLYSFSATDFKYKNKLNSSYVKCSEILLDFLNTNDLLLDFILALIKVTQSPDSGKFKSRLAALWCSEILVALHNSHQFINKFKSMKMVCHSNKIKLKSLFHQWFPDKAHNALTLNLLKAPPPELLNISFVKPIIAEYNQYLTYFIKELLDLLEPGLDSDTANGLCALANLIAVPDKYPTPSTDRIYTADDIRGPHDDTGVSLDDMTDDTTEDILDSTRVRNDSIIIDTSYIRIVDGETIPFELNMQQSNSRERPIFENNVWQLASQEYDWSSIPIGQTPIKTIPNQPD